MTAYYEAEQLGLVEFKKCAIFLMNGNICVMQLGLVEFKKCAIFSNSHNQVVTVVGACRV